jgi:hypothetical protein
MANFALSSSKSIYKIHFSTTKENSIFGTISLLRVLMGVSNAIGMKRDMLELLQHNSI